MEGMIHDFLYTDVGVCPPKGAHSYHAIEAPKGELGFYIISDGTGKPWRVRIKAPSFSNLQGLEYMMEGAMIGDMVILIGTIDRSWAKPTSNDQPGSPMADFVKKNRSYRCRSCIRSRRFRPTSFSSRRKKRPRSPASRSSIWSRPGP